MNQNSELFCPACGLPLKNTDRIAVCEDCGTLQHLLCWQNNAGCCVPRCTGRIQSVIEPDFGQSDLTQNVSATNVAPQYDLLCSFNTLQINLSAGIAVEYLDLIRETANNTVLIRCGFRALTDRSISAIMVDIICKDVWGNPLPGLTDQQFLDLKTHKNNVFGENHIIVLPDANTRSATVIIKKVLYANGEILECDNKNVPFPAAVTLQDHYSDKSIAEQFARETTGKAVYVPHQVDDIWRCTCGNIYIDGQERCDCCGSTYSGLAVIFNDPTRLTENLQQYEQEQQRLKLIRETEYVQWLREAEERQKEDQLKLEAQNAAQAEIRRRQKQRKKISTILIAIPTILIAAVLLFVFYIKPLGSYNTAKAYFASGSYSDAYAIYNQLGNFMDSSEMAKECLYQIATGYLNAGEYDLAASQFAVSSLDGYKDTATMRLEVKYQHADYEQNAGRYGRAYNMFNELGDYKQSKDEVEATVLLWCADALGQDSNSEARTFIETVDKKTEFYPLVYNTVVLYLNGHADYTYWNESFGVHLENVLSMLDFLPESYQDCSSLSNLINYIYAQDFDSLFRDNEYLVRSYWHIPFVRDMAQSDSAIYYFLEGYWATSGGSYYLNFYEQDDGGTYCSYNLPRPSQPKGTKYYEIRSNIWIWTDKDNKELKKVYRIEVVDYDVIQVYCYKNGKTYKLYR